MGRGCAGGGSQGRPGRRRTQGERRGSPVLALLACCPLTSHSFHAPGGAPSAATLSCRVARGSRAARAKVRQRRGVQEGLGGGSHSPLSSCNLTCSHALTLPHDATCYTAHALTAPASTPPPINQAWPPCSTSPMPRASPPTACAAMRCLQPTRVPSRRSTSGCAFSRGDRGSFI